jgi:hypothetical protein
MADRQDWYSGYVIARFAIALIEIILPIAALTFRQAVAIESVKQMLNSMLIKTGSGSDGHGKG